MLERPVTALLRSFSRSSLDYKTVTIKDTSHGEYTSGLFVQGSSALL